MDSPFLNSSTEGASSMDSLSMQTQRQKFWPTLQDNETGVA